MEGMQIAHPRRSRVGIMMLVAYRLLPPFESDKDRQRLNEVIRNSIGAIVKLQEQAEDMLLRHSLL